MSNSERKNKANPVKQWLAFGMLLQLFVYTIVYRMRLRSLRAPGAIPFYLRQFRGDGRIRTGDRGFADPCLTTWPRRHKRTLTRV